MKKSSIYYTDTGTLFVAVFGIVSFILFLAVVISVFFTIKNYNHLKSIGVETIAYIRDIKISRDSDGDYNHDVSISFTDKNNINRVVPVNFYSSKMYVGKEITIIYDPENLSNIQLKGSVLNYIFILIPLILFCVFSFVTFMLYKVMIKPNKNSKHLKANGRIGIAEFMEINHNRNLSINGRRPFILTCRYTHTDGKVYIMRSSNLKYDPSEFIEGNEIKFYYDPNDYSKYFVDVEGSMRKEVVFV